MLIVIVTVIMNILIEVTSVTDVRLSTSEFNFRDIYISDMYMYIYIYIEREIDRYYVYLSLSLSMYIYIYTYIHNI